MGGGVDRNRSSVMDCSEQSKNVGRSLIRTLVVILYCENSTLTIIHLTGENAPDSHRQDSIDSGGSMTTRKLLTDMECGAYNSDSLGSPSAGASGQSGEQVTQFIKVTSNTLSMETDIQRRVILKEEHKSV